MLFINMHIPGLNLDILNQTVWELRAAISVFQQNSQWVHCAGRFGIQGTRWPQSGFHLWHQVVQYLPQHFSILSLPEVLPFTPRLRAKVGRTHSLIRNHEGFRHSFFRYWAVTSGDRTQKEGSLLMERVWGEWKTTAATKRKWGTDLPEVQGSLRCHWGHGRH